MDALSRRIVEMVKDAKRISIGFTEGREEDGLTLHFDGEKKNIRKLAHDIALALQDYMNER